MKKIGILTHFRHYNYGTVLQAYALEHFLNKEFECKAELIDYLAKNEYVGKKLLITRFKRLGIYIKYLYKYFVIYKNRHNENIKSREFNDFFEKRMVLSDKKTDMTESLSAICNEYDAIMIGSDQTWNPYVSTKGEYLLEYLKNESVSKLSYAPSLGTGKIPKEYIERYKSALSDFKALSLRERGGAEYLSDLLGRHVDFVLDPTLLLTKEDWAEIEEPIDIKEPYLLTYFLGDNKYHRQAAEKIAKEKKLKVVALPISYLEMKNKGINKQYVGPGGFISLIKNASFVCTDSFHGTMFSINFQKDFVSFPKRNDMDINSDNNRLYDALEVLGLRDRLGDKEEIVTMSIDYSEVNKKLEALRHSSKEYLKYAISLI